MAKRSVTKATATTATAKRSAAQSVAAKASAVRVTAAKAGVVRKRAAEASDEDKHVGDVLGISRSRVKAPLAGAPKAAGRRRATGVELPKAASTTLRPARVVGGVRGRGR